MEQQIIAKNKQYWDDHADLWDKGAGELWGLDLSQKQLDNAKQLLIKKGCNPKLICASMEEESGIPKVYYREEGQTN